MSEVSVDEEEALADACSVVTKRLRARSAEITLALDDRMRETAYDALLEEDLQYRMIVRGAMAETLQDMLDAIERDERDLAFLGRDTTREVRRAVRSGVALDVVLRRHFATQAVLGEFVAVETANERGELLRRLLRQHAMLLDARMAAIARQYESELQLTARSPEHLTTERVLSILRGSDAGARELEYEFDAWHLGIVAVGAEAEAAVRVLVRRSDHLLPVRRSDDTWWAWIGSRRRVAPDEIEALLLNRAPHKTTLAVGQPGHGIEGWRLTHRQAQGAALISALRPQPFTRYVGEMLVATALLDDTLAASLAETYLVPLYELRDGSALRQTLLAYFEAGCNAATAAARLAVDRHTVKRRLDKVERILERPLQACRAELEVALRLDVIRSLPHA